MGDHVSDIRGWSARDAVVVGCGVGGGVGLGASRTRVLKVRATPVVPCTAERPSVLDL